MTKKEALKQIEEMHNIFVDYIKEEIKILEKSKTSKKTK